MKTRLLAFLSGILLPGAVMASQEGVPVYYQSQAAGQASGGYAAYVGQSGQKQVVGTRSQTYQVPRTSTPILSGTMTANGISMPADAENGTRVFAGYNRRFADFEFKTGVNSILEWDDMLFNEITVGAQHNFSVRNFDMFAYGEYTYGDLAHGGLSMDYDLDAFDSSRPFEGIFTISMGNLSGRTNHFRFGIGARHVWDLGGWKLSPSIGYEIFKHNLEMSDHIYPNPGVYLPLMTDKGDYVYGDASGYYYSLPIGTTPPDDWYQVCMSPEDIKVVPAPGSGIEFGTSLPAPIDWNSALGTIPWGVEAGDCVIIGGDGAIVVEGTTHIYNTTWSGFYIGLEVEKQMTLSDKLRFYVQFGLPKYSSEGIWPNRTDWQQNPSFIDEGSNGAYSYAAEMEYNYRLSDRLQLALKVDTNVFHVGKIPGELYIAEESHYLIDQNG
ncbi:hypothetical protein HDR63_02575, partial [bacterium]|nr:hypothetical protein [bacterium]